MAKKLTINILLISVFINNLILSINCNELIVIEKSKNNLGEYGSTAPEQNITTIHNVSNGTEFIFQTEIPVDLTPTKPEVPITNSIKNISTSIDKINNSIEIKPSLVASNEETVIITTTVKTLEQELIPPANITPNIGHRNVSSDLKKRIVTVVNAQSDCPSLEDADKLSQTQLVERLTHGCRYDKLERPLIHKDINGTQIRLPVDVFARAYIYFMQNLEAHDLQFKIHALLQLRFVDPRLAFKSVAPSRTKPIIGEKSLRQVLWIPHIFFANERDSSILGTDQKDILTSISPDGTVIISHRIQATLYCWMNLQKFPFDKQKCATTLESWMYTSSDLVLHWEDKSPITLSPDFHLTEYSLLNITRQETIINADLRDLRHGAFAGNYSSLSFTLHLEREMGFYLLDYFLPSMMIVAISWVSFWLQADQSAPRIMLGTSTMLTFITLASAQGKTLPKVSYIKVSEIWFLGCTAFIFGSLVEFAFVNTIWRRKKDIALKEKNSKYILRATLTPRPIRKNINSLHKSRSCSSLDGSAILNEQSLPNGGFNNYLTVHSFPTKQIPTIKTESVDDLSSKDNGNVSINLEPLNKSTQEMLSPPTSMDDITNRGWTTMTPQEISMWIDKRSRVVFPLAFLVFNCLFWTFVLLI